MKNIAMLMGAALFVVGCKSMSLTKDAVDAYLPELSSEQHTLLQQAATELFNGYAVTVAQDAFKDTNTLLIERASQAGDRGLPIDGRRTDNAITLSLLLENGVCWLKRIDTDVSIPLPEVDCRALGDNS